ncbi:MAG: amidohydrolase family protein [Gemmatimonadota bacterium]|nr:amidohydrolase family protein [Gemmatimonadota bacterium]
MINVGILLILSITPAEAQETAPTAGMRDNTPRVHALTNVRIVQAPGRTVERGTVILRDGVVESVGASVRVPADAQLWDYTGHTVYAGMIEMYSKVGLKAVETASGGAKHWNPNVHPEYHAADLYQVDKKAIHDLRALGFTAALALPDQGILSGAGTLVNLGDGTPIENILKGQVAQHIRFRPSRHGYPVSLMGSMALIRQTLLDAGWYHSSRDVYARNPAGRIAIENNEALAALDMVLQGQQPVLVSVDDDQSFLRAAKIGSEFGLKIWIKGSGLEYHQIDLIKATGIPVILPVNFPKVSDINVASVEEALEVSLETLRHWDAAPENPGRLQNAGIPFALTSAGLKKQSDFPARVRQAIERGLNYNSALAAVTTTPAQILGLRDRLGTIEPGKLAHLTVTDGPLFAENVEVRDVWVHGIRYEVTPRSPADPRGKWQVTLHTHGSPVTASVEIKGHLDRLTGDLEGDSLQRVSLVLKRLGLLFSGDKMGFNGVVRMSGSIEGEHIQGRGVLPDGQRFTWAGTRSERPPTPSKPIPTASDERALPQISPPVAFGRPELPQKPANVLVRNTTVWTMDDQGKMEKTDIHVSDGKIARIGRNLEAPRGAVEIDGRGKHVTPGMIDAHLHVAMAGGGNESGQAVSAEVAVADIIENYAIAIYRGLSGGLTTANLLHGSANPIGGQNQIIKMRWGASAEGLKLQGAMPGIKFALGENVKRSNSSQPQTRYPASRMGVEQLIRDRFKAAQDYNRAWTAYNAVLDKSIVMPPRRDLELDAMVEILKGERLVHSHSYRQDEILMLIRVAEDFGFKIGTFQHVLEGYKVADAIARHGAGASTFSDGWGFKVEAFDAIPYNGALMHNAGVLVTYNSDDVFRANASRRLNTQAAKAVKYGGVNEIEALEFVTINAAKQLRIDDRIGSLEVGKDADFVIWNGHPLSTYTICAQTWIDGRKYFDLEEDKVLRRQVVKERAELIQKLLSAKKDGDKAGA